MIFSTLCLRLFLLPFVVLHLLRFCKCYHMYDLSRLTTSLVANSSNVFFTLIGISQLLE